MHQKTDALTYLEKGAGVALDDGIRKSLTNTWQKRNCAGERLVSSAENTGALKERISHGQSLSYRPDFIVFSPHIKTPPELKRIECCGRLKEAERALEVYSFRRIQ